MPDISPIRLVLAGAHESDNGADVGFLADTFPDLVITSAGRSLHNSVSAALATDRGPVAVLPMTFGRNPPFVADVAKTLKWLAGGAGRGRVVLCEPFGSIDHLTAWLRRAATTIATEQPGAAMLITARKSNPFDDAELHRVAHLVRTHGADVEVDVTGGDSEDEIVARVERLRLLGRDRIVTVPAGFARQSAAAYGIGALSGVSFFGALMSGKAIARVVRERLTAAEHSLSHGHDGIEDGLQADHGHGYAHSHAFETSQAGTGPAAAGQGSHGHSHNHSHPHSHSHDNAVAEPDSSRDTLTHSH